MTLVAVAPNKYARGFDGSGASPASAYRVLELREALTRTYSTDAHLVAYVVEGVERQPRINKAGLPHFMGKVMVGAFFCDVDNPQHSNWNRELLDAALAQYDSLPVLQTAGIYHTEHGRRIVQPVDQPIPAAQVEPYVKRWLLQLEAAGLPVDWACRDWTRHFRLPNVRRAGYPYRSPYMRLGHMRPVAVEPIVFEASPVATTAATLSRPAPAIEWSAEVPEVWRPRIQPIADAVRRVASEWHSLFMALAGALLSRRVPHEHVPAICRAVSLATGVDTRTGDRELAARSTVQRQLAGLPTTGYSSLVEGWPTVAFALNAALATGNEARLRAQIAAPPCTEPRTLVETTAALEEAIRRAPDGLTLISAECGLGKTAAAVRVAAERAAKPYATEDAKGERAPPQSKSAISVDKNALAIQIANDLSAAGAKVRRVFGPLSLRNADGSPVCRYHDVARPLVEGGQAMQWELCRGRDKEPCEHFATCPARKGAEGPDDARVTVGPHALISTLDVAAGSTGLLIIDEPPPLLETVMFTLEDLDAALRLLIAFDQRFAAAMKPALVALRAWVGEVGQPDEVSSLPDAIRACGHVLDPWVLAEARLATGARGDAFDCVAAATPPERQGRPPPLLHDQVRAARRNVEHAKQLGVASRLTGAICRAANAKLPVCARIEEKAGFGRVLFLTFTREPMAAALQREGAVVVTDANADLHQAIMAKVVGYQPPLHRFAAIDGAPITRTLIRCGTATRKGWIKGGNLTIDGSLAHALRSAIEWAREDPTARKLGLITMRVVELAIAGALHPDDSSVDGAWRNAGQNAAVLEHARSTLGPILQQWPGEIRLAHYGAVRGLNDMADVDCLITLGDPWPNLGEVRNDVAYLALEQAWESRLEHLCRAELEQAHGRLRTVHRARPGRALHVGNVLPGGTGWSGTVEVRRLEGGRPVNTTTVEANEVANLVDAVGGLRKAARLLGCSPSSLLRYQTGLRSMPASLSADLRRAATQGVPETPIRHILL